MVSTRDEPRPPLMAGSGHTARATRGAAEDGGFLQQDDLVTEVGGGDGGRAGGGAAADTDDVGLHGPLALRSGSGRRTGQGDTRGEGGGGHCGAGKQSAAAEVDTVFALVHAYSLVVIVFF